MTKECWIGTAVIDESQGLIEHQVSNGPAGSRSHSADFLNPDEALAYARKNYDVVHIEGDFRPDLVGARWSSPDL